MRPPEDGDAPTPGTAAPGADPPDARAPAVTRALIAVCCAVFLIGPVSGLNRSYGTGEALTAAQGAYFARWGVIPAALVDGTPGALLTPLTALFVHGNWLHLLGNMLFLYVFGAMTEEHLGRLRFTLFYLGAGYAALAAYAVANADSEQTLVGASGAISAVLGAFLFLFPKARVTSLFPFLFFLPLRFPARLVLVFWFVLQWLAATGLGQGSPAVAYLAHLVGFAIGFLYAWGRFRRPARVKAPAAATEGDSQP
ncbi:rhomboid family intramembrane serine protease [Streptomyces sp. SID5473]|uniref:Rhomboid family intramembrane serine protease n=1 Tax=Streptomyces tsukubensis (strain DSM 42081 / NBRC 108919 / NRRL 18488 / 9993) TaxID=1114943 RepID=I2MX07_STRT9|nr:rhomboid family intramembrane serine protease [Streptomyces tsukubensis]EIF89304.1 Rhomboid family protein [Streptomyces tsukubensis NRRL18488]MYS64645.1 rhomboid family intramembrane serine protease [Streptomyces sp. SID5473]QKM70155.1 rhomboid family intramembrane serine protease [Streptomyces tsukubensis NRRL18488]TAI46493.1 rhomboid family intramembrane serine protease [Streptomyces tsukubensis]